MPKLITLLSRFYRFVSLASLFILFHINFVNAAPPTFSATFSPGNIGPGSQSTLIYTVTNNDLFVINDVAFSNVLPSGVTLATPASAITTCFNGSLTAIDGGTTVDLSGASIVASSSCSVSVRVTSNTVATHTNTTGDLTSDQGNSGSASDDLIVSTDRPGYSLSFSPASVNRGEISTLSLNFDNSANPNFAFGMATTVSLSTGLQIASFPNVITNCDTATITASAGSSSIVFSGAGLLAAGSSCSVDVDVVASGVGNLIASSESLTATDGGTFTSVDSGKAGSSLASVQSFGVLDFETNPVAPGGITNLNITLTNFDRSNSATNITFSDDLDAALSGMVAIGLPLNDVCGSGSQISGTSIISLTGGSLSPEGSCTFTVPVQIPANAIQGNYSNTTSAFNYDLGGSSVSSLAVTNSLSITLAPQVSMTFASDTAAAGSDTTIDFTITNPDTVNSASSIAFTQNLSTTFAGVQVASLPASGFCGGGSSIVNSGFDEVDLSISGADLAAGASCSFSVDISIVSGTPSGNYISTTSDITATISGSPVSGVGASDSINIVDGPSLVLELPLLATAPGTPVTATFTLANDGDGSLTATGIGFTLNLGTALSDLTTASLPLSDVCGAGSSVLLVDNGGNDEITLTGGSLSEGSSCTFDVVLDVPVGASSGSYDLTTSNVTSTVSGISVTGSAITTKLIVTNLDGSMSFTDDPVAPGDSAILEFSFQNTSSTEAISNMIFTLNLNAVIPGLVATGLPANDVCGTGSSITGTSFLIFTGGNLASSTDCIFAVSVDIPVGATTNTFNAISSNVIFDESSGTITDAPLNDVLTVVVDEAPNVSITSASSPSTSVTPISVTMTFNEDVTGFDINDITGSVSNGSLGNFNAVSASIYTVEITPAADGPVTLQVPAASAQDSGANDNNASSVFSIDFDAVAFVLPTVSIGPPDQSLTNTGPVSFTITYSDADQIDLDPAEVNVIGTPTATVSVSDGATSTPTVTLSSISGDGTLAISLTADTARNSFGSTAASGNSAVFNVDNTSPDVSISSTEPDPTNSAFNITMTFTEAVSGFADTDIVLDNATLSNFAGGATLYSATVTPTADGTVSVDIPVSAANDTAGNGNTAASQFSLTYDGTAPTGYDISIDQTFLNATNDTAMSFSYIGAEVGAAFNYEVTDGSGSVSASGVIGSADGSVSGIDVSGLAEGVLTLRFTLTDTAGNAGVAITDTIIRQINDAPVITEGGSTSVTMSEDGSPSDFSLTLNATDAEMETISWRISSDASNGAAAATGTGNSKVISYTPNPDFNGSDSFIVEVTDNNTLDPLTDSIVVNVTINPENDAPTVDSAAVVAVLEDSVYVYNVNSSDIDVGDTLSVSATTLPSWLALTDNGDGTALLTGTPLNDNVGNNSVTLVVNDDSGATNNSATQSFTIVVANTNDIPAFDSTAPTNATEDIAYSYAITTSDVDVGDTLSISASTLPGWLNLTDNGNGTAILAGTPLNANVGSNTVVLVVSDVAGAAANQSFVVNVANTNDAPTFVSSAPTNVDEDSTYTYAVIANDIDVGDSINISASTLPGWLNLTDNGGGSATLTGTPVNADVGIHSVVLEVTDIAGTSANQSFSVAVSNTNDAPAFSSSAPTAVAEDSVYTYAISASDIDVGDSLSFSAATIPGWLNLTDNGNGTAILTGTPLNENVGSNAVALSVSDVAGATENQNFTITVSNTNDLPTGQPIITGMLLRNETLSVDTSAIADDDGLGTFSYQWRRGGVPLAGATNSTYIPGEDDVWQTFSVVVSYIDAAGANESVTSPETDVISDLDSDGDGIFDLEEGTGDSDGDGIPDYLDEDSDNDGIPDSEEGNDDSDGDGIPDYLDTSLDEDGDGIPDALDGDANTDTDGDGINDGFDLDSDNDGIPDFDESGASGIDSDGDGIDDIFDVDATGGTDDDGDGIDDNVALIDTDNDGIPDYIDRDSDNDSIPDALENSAGLALKQAVASKRQAQEILEVTSKLLEVTSDIDGDGLLDSRDPDSDEDGISDLAEAATNFVDSDGDQVIDEFDADFTGGIDANLDGVDDVATLQNSDNDLTPDMFDLDSDNDGNNDVIEAGFVDIDLNGLIDLADVRTDFPVDSDSDGLSDYLDLDSDDDGIFDIVTSGAATLDQDGDGQIDDGLVADADGDGIVDVMDDEPDQFGTSPDRDSDGVPSSIDRDDDGDGISDLVEGLVDSDSDGIIDSFDTDSDNDGLSDRFESDRPAPMGEDIDRDGIDDLFDVDFSGGIDSNADGVDDKFVNADTDGDGVVDYLDNDSDNDQISDAEEQLLVQLTGIDSDRDGLDDAVDVDVSGGQDNDSDGQDDASISNVDLDGDGLLAFRDTDTDGDGISDLNENGDFNQDGVNDRLQAEIEVRETSGGGSLGIFALLLLFCLIGMQRAGSGNKVFALFLALTAMSVNADNTCDSGSNSNSICWYTGIGYGQSELEPQTSLTSWRVDDDSDAAARFFLGVDFQKNWFVEFAYSDLGKATLINLNPAQKESGFINYDMTELALGYRIIPGSGNYSVNFKAGFAGLDTNSDFLDDDSDSFAVLGVGVKWNLKNQLALSLNYDGYGDDISLISLNLHKYF